MLKRISESSPVHVSILLISDFSLIALSSIIEPMRITNRVVKKTAYTWEIISKDGSPVNSSSGIEVSADYDITSCAQPSNAIICSGLNAHTYYDPIVFSYLRRWAIQGAYLGAVCTGSHILAHAGLLTDYNCTIYWGNIDSLTEEYSDTKVQQQLFTIDRDRFTCSGGTAGIDMMLKNIKNIYGRDIASTVSEQFMHQRIRESYDNQHLPLQTRLRTNHPKLLKAISRMEENTEEPLSREEISKQVNLSHRQLERLFKKYLGSGPAKYYLMLRLEHAKILLQTDTPITEVALTCGFKSASHFSKCYKDLFNITPRQERRSTSELSNKSLKDETREAFQQILEDSINDKILEN